MLWFDAEMERVVTDAELQLAASQLVGCTRDKVLIIREGYPPLDSPPVCISARANPSGQFALQISVYLFAPLREVADWLTLLEAGSLLAMALHMRVLVPNDETSDPYSFVLIESNGEGAIADVDGEQMDLHNSIEIRRVGHFGRVSRLGRADIVSLLLHDGICRPEEIAGLAESIVASQEQRIAAELPWQYREFLFAVGAGAGRFLRGDGALYNDPQQTAVQLRSLSAEYSDLDSLVDALIAGNGVYPLSAGPVLFRYFKLGKSVNPVVYEWNHRLPWPVPAWATLSAFLSASIRNHAE